MLSPSENLTNLLNELRVCSAHELAACEPEVRRLTGDLPNFDLCWLDVLVAHRLLTPWQAECLQSEDPFRMRQGPYRLREPLGARTWLAETFDRRRLVVLNLLNGPDDQTTHRACEHAQSLLDIIEETPSLHVPSLCLPREYLFRDGGGGWVVSPFIPGWQLDELLVRGGRLPWRVVVETGRMILQGLQQLHQADLCHGDVSLRNIRVQPDGQVVLVDPFSTRLLRPSIGYRADLKLRDIRHCAPELVGADQRPKAACDLYSTGTVLWQLLSGRPTFISTDPVTFLMQCRNQDVDNVQRWVPDCPDRVAREILALTRRRPELRPQSAAIALKSWSQLSRPGSSATRTLLKRMPDRQQNIKVARPTARHGRMWKRAGAVAAVVGAVMVGLSSHLVPLPLNLRRTSTTDLPTHSAESIEPVLEKSAPTNELLPLPEPSADGLVELVSGQRYEMRTLQRPGTLTIRSHSDDLAVIEVSDDRSHKLIADQILFSGIELRGASSTSGAALADIHCRGLKLDRVIVTQLGHRNSTGLRWTPASIGSTVASISNSVFESGRSGIHTTSAPDHFVMKNVLFNSAESAWRCDVQSSDRVLVHLNRVTQRGGSSFADVFHQGSAGSLQIELTCGESVLVPAEAVVRLASSSADWTPEKTTIAFRLPGRANPVIISPSLHPAVWFDRSLRQKVAVDDSRIISESLLMAETEFLSSNLSGASFDSAKLVDYDGPKRGQHLPGVDTALLPKKSDNPHLIKDN